MERQFLICECESLEHLACFTYFDENVVIDNDGAEKNFKYVTLSVHLNKLPLFKRLVAAIKYIFGHTSVYGDYDEFIIKPTDIGKFRKVVKHLEKCK